MMGRAPSTELERHPRAFALAAITLLAETGLCVGMLNVELLEELGGGILSGTTEGQREAIRELAKAARRFVDAARAAVEAGCV
jgi:hypothetical protein